MENRRVFLRKTTGVALCTALTAATACRETTKKTAETTVKTKPSAPSRQCYEFRHYFLKAGHEAEIDQYFEHILIPAYNRKGIKVGAYKPYKEGENPLRILHFIYEDIVAYRNIKHEIWQDSEFTADAKPYFDKSAPNPYFTNIETALCEAFTGFSTLKQPKPTNTLVELRTYWSPNEEANQRKISMFNNEEIALFDKIGLKSACYGEVFAGPRTPALMYLTWYEDMAVHDKNWNDFRTHPDWEIMKKKPQYANTATNNRVELLYVMPYSQI